MSKTNNLIEDVKEKNSFIYVASMHPHKNHLTSKNYYKEEMGLFLENIIKNSSYKNNILHVDFNKNFQKIYDGYEFEKIFLQNDVTSHLTVSTYENVFFPYILSKVSD